MLKTYKYTCIQNKQRSESGAPLFLMFRATAQDISEWAAIERYTKDSQKGPQRLKKPAKIAEVKSFFQKDARNTIPTALLVRLTVPSEGLGTPIEALPEVVPLQFEYDPEGSPEGKPGMIIDGQHRLLGVKEYDPNTQLNVVALINISDDETAFQFLVVNNKASKVTTNHLRALVHNYKEEDLSKRLRDIRMSISQHLDFVGLVDSEDGSPFKGIIDWSNNQSEGASTKAFVQTNAIESCIAYIKQKRVPELDDDSILLGFFLTIWKKIAAKWAQQFTQQSHLLEKAPIICLNQFIVDNLCYEYDNDTLEIADFEKVGASVNRVIDSLSAKLWDAKWTSKSLDTSAGRNLLVAALTQIRRNINAGRNWYENVSIVDLQSDLL